MLEGVEARGLLGLPTKCEQQRAEDVAIRKKTIEAQIVRASRLERPEERVELRNHLRSLTIADIFKLQAYHDEYGSIAGLLDGGVQARRHEPDETYEFR